MAYLPAWAMYGKIFIHFIICLSLFSSYMGAAGGSSNETDRLSLLAFKAKITADPNGIMLLWNHSIPFCQWFGVVCGIRHQRVTRLNLFSLKLGGAISPHVGNLSFLKVLDLQNNSFIDQIPPEIGRLRRLRVLNLNNNSIGGGIPANLSGCSRLESLHLQYNMLERDIPMELGSLFMLQHLSLAANNLSGIIPTSLGNLTSLERFSLALNNLIGTIPSTFGSLKHLIFLSLLGNHLSGELPISLFNISSIENLDISSNKLGRSLPPNMFETLANLQSLDITDNQFTGRIPISLSNASNLDTLQLATNQLYGKVPSVQNLNMLWAFVVSWNQLGSGVGGQDDLSFLCSMTNATSLYWLEFGYNNLGGMLPACITNLSSQLAAFRAFNNNISGSIPSGIDNLIGLQLLEISGNLLTGTIPPTMGNLQNLVLLYLFGNKLSGPIPSSLGNLSKLNGLLLSDNSLEGTIPSTLKNCTLLQLELEYNKLTGSIPPQVLTIRSLSISLALSHNQLSGPLPNEVGELTQLTLFQISSNMLSGKIPDSLGECISLQVLGLDGNNFQGHIPSSLSSMKGLQSLNLADNNLSGQIPEFLTSLNLTMLNLSFNDLEGVVPIKGAFRNASITSLEGNSKLCGGISAFHLPQCNNSTGSKERRLFTKRKIAIATISGAVGIALAILLLYVLRSKRKGKQIQEESAISPSENRPFQFVSYGDLHRATNGFSKGSLVGGGSFGSVFKGVLTDGGQAVAIKVLNLNRLGASRSFVAECEALRNIRHKNLVKLLTVCSGVDYQGNEFKALIYEFMPNGSLEDWLHPLPLNEHDPPRKLSLLKRLGIAIDVASSLGYVHHEFGTTLVHCDIKPSNILLDDDLSGHVSDFGLAKFLSDGGTIHSSNHPSSSVGIRGTIGYAPPEYGLGSEVSTQGDVYSYGILLLEMCTGKRPTHEMFKESLNLHLYCKMALPNGVVQILDPTLQDFLETEDAIPNPGRSERVMECLALVVEIGVACSHESPAERMGMATVATKLRKINDNLLTGVN